MRRVRNFAAIAASVLLSTGPALSSTLLTGWNQSSLNFITDGTSNTILFSETTQLAICFNNVTIPGSFSTADGTSNTILFGETNPWGVHSAFTRPLNDIGTIADGTSNTILIGEISGNGFCLGGVTLDPEPPGEFSDFTNPIDFGANSSFDICADQVSIGTIQDGTSNTIIFGETSPRVCYAGVQVSEQATASPEPPTAPLLLAGALAAFSLTRLRRKAA